VAVIGLGKIAIRSHLPGFAKAKGCRLTAVYSSREDAAKKIALQYGIPSVYTDWRLLLKSPEVDAVSVCTTNSTHAPITHQAFREGKHVLVEKPMATSVADARAMDRAARRAKKVLMVHHNMHFDPAIRTAAALLHKNVIGEVFSFKCSMAHRGPQNWSPTSKWFFEKRQAGGGVLMDLGPHMLESLCFLLGDTPATMAAVLPSKPTGWFGDGEAHCSCLLKFKKGVIGTLTLSWADVTYQNRIYFYGSKGTLHVNLAKGDPITLQYRNKDEKIYPSLLKSAFKPSLYQHFVDCVREGREPWVGGREGVKNVELIEAGYRSAREHRMIQIH
jgi:predicted dehydrogenase